MPKAHDNFGRIPSHTMVLLQRPCRVRSSVKGFAYMVVMSRVANKPKVRKGVPCFGGWTPRTRGQRRNHADRTNRSCKQRDASHASIDERQSSTATDEDPPRFSNFVEADERLLVAAEARTGCGPQNQCPRHRHIVAAMRLDEKESLFFVFVGLRSRGSGFAVLAPPLS